MIHKKYKSCLTKPKKPVILDIMEILGIESPYILSLKRSVILHQLPEDGTAKGHQE